MFLTLGKASSVRLRFGSWKARRPLSGDLFLRRKKRRHTKQKLRGGDDVHYPKNCICTSVHRVTMKPKPSSSASSKIPSASCLLRTKGSVESIKFSSPLAHSPTSHTPSSASMPVQKQLSLAVLSIAKAVLRMVCQRESHHPNRKLSFFIRNLRPLYSSQCLRSQTQTSHRASQFRHHSMVEPTRRSYP